MGKDLFLIDVAPVGNVALGENAVVKNAVVFNLRRFLERLIAGCIE